MKRILISLSIIGVVAAVGLGITAALFNDTETSSGNIFTAGTLDLKVDHTWETYNDVDCNTCDLTLISDPTNMVVKKNGGAVTSYPAVFVGSLPPYFIHSAWTAQNDSILQAAGARWIWESDPTRDEDVRVDVTYTFEKTFEWYGPILSSDLWFGVGSDNSIKIWLNGVLIAENDMEFGYRQENMLHIPGSVVNSHIVQGQNVLTFEVKNWALIKTPPATYRDNPGGLIYKFYISGNCQEAYFKSHCKLWSLKDLVGGDIFWNFNDIKPGDHGTNIISLHAYNNDAFACLITDHVVDLDNTLTEPEVTLNDTLPLGELSQFVKIFAWQDSNHNNVYDVGETILVPANSPLTAAMNPAIALTASNTKFIGLAWCVGTQSVVGNVISCSGASVGDIAQTDSFTAYITAYAEQQRNNAGFDCSKVILP
jgi:predicted ribosomally synthesized peptide with SipW-like signal peptide